MGNLDNHTRRILVVEDDPSMTIMLKSSIAGAAPDAKVCYASSIEQALAKILQSADISNDNPYDLIVADIFLEGHSTGLDLWKVISSTYPNLPFLVISSVSEQEVRKAVGEEDQSQLIYLQKPFSVKAFKDKVQSIFEKAAVNTISFKGKVEGESRPELIHNDEHEQMAHLLMLKMSSDWLSKQEWVNEPYGGQNPAQELLFHARISAHKLWEDFFISDDKQITLDKQKIREHLLKMGDLNPELKKFLEEKLDNMESVFQIH
ncbi:response regulator [Pseudobdellovibrio exovorus]|uniref:Response regulatory domain-containing protein n=1 Tax=Pseudobdellovibrio exovorus JSS TaxID=1184267 RepID=M4V8B4_9BACT|nr:response regulator [Pseudobdellovibrio exovorus]AGH95453.1 hypothetical protein A11Q_1237 [Pseudobdellovibrio exovorus JSS]